MDSEVLIFLNKGSHWKLGGEYAFLYYIVFDADNMEFLVKSKFVQSDFESIRKDIIGNENVDGIVKTRTVDRFMDENEKSMDIVKRNIEMFMSYLSENWGNVIRWANSKDLIPEARVSAISRPSNPAEPNVPAKGEPSKKQWDAPSDDELAQDWGYDDWDDFASAQD